MKKILIVSGHTDLNNSAANKSILENHESALPQAEFIYLDKLYPDIKFVNRLMTHSWGQKIVRFYDLDGNLIEVGTPM